MTLLILGLLLQACDEPAGEETGSEAIVIVYAQPGVMALTHSVRVEVWDALGATPSAAHTFSLDRISFPFSFKVSQREGGAKLFRVVVRALSSNGSQFVERTIAAAFTDASQLLIPVALEDTCGFRFCAADQSCRDGLCAPIAMFPDHPSALPAGVDIASVPSDLLCRLIELCSGALVITTVSARRVAEHAASTPQCRQLELRCPDFAPRPPELPDAGRATDAAASG